MLECSDEARYQAINDKEHRKLLATPRDWISGSSMVVGPLRLDGGSSTDLPGLETATVNKHGKLKWGDVR